MESIKILNSILEYSYDIDTNDNISTVLFYVPYNPYNYKTENINIDSYYTASNTAYKKAEEYAKMLSLKGIECKPNPHINLKAAALRCGGGAGKNTLVYRKNAGSRFAIGALQLKQALPKKAGEILEMPCKDCNLCQKACPLGAIGESFDRKKCMREYMLKPEKAEENILNAFGSRLLGCDICQSICPLNCCIEAQTQPEHISKMLNIENLYKQIKEKKLKEFVQNYGTNYANGNSLLSMLLIIAGNSGDKKYLEFVKENLKSQSGRVKFAAEYALKKLLN